jgi:hypothetical protein
MKPDSLTDKCHRLLLALYLCCEERRAWTFDQDDLPQLPGHLHPWYRRCRTRFDDVQSASVRSPVDNAHRCCAHGCFHLRLLGSQQPTCQHRSQHDGIVSENPSCRTCDQHDRLTHLPASSNPCSTRYCTVGLPKSSLHPSVAPVPDRAEPPAAWWHKRRSQGRAESAVPGWWSHARRCAGHRPPAEEATRKAEFLNVLHHARRKFCISLRVRLRPEAILATAIAEGATSWTA